MEPVEKTVNQERSPEVRPLERSTMVDVKVNRTEPVSVTAPSRLFLFQYVTMLFSGLVLLCLVSIAGYSLLEHWLGDASKTGFLSEYVYFFHLYLLVSIVLFGGLHIWMRALTGKVERKDQPASSGVFLAIFLTILAITILGAVGAIVYIGVDMLLGTGNYSAKSSWLAILDALQVIVWSGLLWWYFKRSSAATMWYIGAVGVVTIAVATLLVIFPILSKRDAVIDSRTSNDLTSIVGAVNTYASKNNKLPEKLSDLTIDDDKVVSRLGSYEYQINPTPAPQQEEPSYSLEDFFNGSSDSSLKPSSSVFSYKLCADFKTDTTKDSEGVVIPLFYSPSELSRHPSGKHCFEQTAYGGSPESPRPSPVDASRMFSEES